MKNSFSRYKRFPAHLFKVLQMSASQRTIGGCISGRCALGFALILLAAATFAGCSYFPSAPSQAAYGEKCSCSQGQKLIFPDFSLEFAGTRRVSLPQYPRGFLYYDFTITLGDQKQTVSWTTGTGLIGPMEFQVNGKKYILERLFSDKLGKLGENQLTISEGGLVR